MLTRFFDFVSALLLLIVTAPVMLIAAVLIRLDSKGPILFKQTRVGYRGRTFTVYKFRTLVHSDDHATPNGLEPVPRVDDFKTFVFNPFGGGRPTTRVGKYLRLTSLDELPNLLNVLKGEMRLVGPRPEVPELVVQYPSEYHRRHEVKPGMTGLAQVSGRGDLTYHETMLYDLEYVRSHSLRCDLSILARTLPALLSRKGAR
ncbi:MAG: sugar transferase [Dehalococcoidia bacterium]